MAATDDIMGDYDPNRQTGTVANPLAQSSTYSPPGQMAPIDQYNHTPDPNAAGGFVTSPPGTPAPVDQANFSTTDPNPPNAGDMAQAAASSIDLTPTVTASGQATTAPTTNDAWANLPPDQLATWNNTYGAQAAPYQYAIQNGGTPNPAGFNALPLDQQNTWYSVYGAQAPQIWQQQSAQNAAAGGAAGGTSNPYGSAIGVYPTTGQTTAPSNPQTIGAGTAGAPYGQGWGWNGQNITIQPGYLPYLNSQSTGQVGGYIPGSSTYNQWVLDQPGLIGNVGGTPNSNLQYGSGGRGDPTTGREPQTPAEWTDAGQAFQWDGNMDGDLGYIANLFGRVDANSKGGPGSGIATDAWSAPKQYWDGLAQQVAAGRVKPTKVGWAALMAKGYTPQGIGGGAVQQAASVGVQANGAGATAGTPGTGTTGPMGEGTAGFNAAYAQNQTAIRGQDLQYAYLNERMKLLEIPDMQNKSALELDKLAFDKAKEAYLEQYQNAQAAEAQRQFNELQGLRTAQTTGQYNGQDTMAMQAQKQAQAQQYLQLLAGLRGPADIFQYMKVLNGTPGGMRDVVNAAAGQYAMPTYGGGATVGGGQVGGGSSDINSLLAQMNNPTYGQSDTQGLNLPLPNQINALALQRMSPSQQQALLAAYESAGYRPEDVMAIFRNSLPSYGANTGGQSTGTVNLFGR